VIIKDLTAQLCEINNAKSALSADDPVIRISLPKRQEHQLSKIMTETPTPLNKWCNENVMTINTDRHPQP
jgi:hypothetical protein